MTLIIGLPEKEIQKVNKDLYELHKRVILNYLLSRSLKLRSRKKFFIVYGHYREKHSRIFLYTYIYIRSTFNPKRIMEMPKISQRY